MGPSGERWTAHRCEQIFEHRNVRLYALHALLVHQAGELHGRVFGVWLGWIEHYERGSDLACRTALIIVASTTKPSRRPDPNKLIPSIAADFPPVGTGCRRWF